VIIYGGNKLRPEFQAAHERNNSPQQDAVPDGTAVQSPVVKDTPADSSAATATVTGPTTIPVPAQSDSQQTSLNQAPVEEPKPVAAAPAATPLKKPDPRVTTIVAVKRPEAALNAAALEYKGRIEEAVADRGLNGRVTIAGIGNTLTLSRHKPAQRAVACSGYADAQGKRVSDTAIVTAAVQAAIRNRFLDAALIFECGGV